MVSKADNTKGGIDLNPSDFLVETKGSPIHFDTDVNISVLNHPPFNGLIPVIENITAVGSLPFLFGFDVKQNLP